MEADRLETKIKELKARVADIEARLIDMDNPEKYAKFVQCEFGNPRLTREGNIEVVIYGASKTNEEAMILDEPAIVDGSAIVKAWLNGEQIGESIYCPDGFDGNLERAGFEKGRSLGVYSFYLEFLLTALIIPVTRELKPEDLGSITFTLEPKTIWAIQKNPAA